MYNGVRMENVTITAKTKQVGNSLVILIPKDIRDKLGLTSNEEVVAHIHKKKKKNVKQILSMFGVAKGHKISWKCEDERRDRF